MKSLNQFIDLCIIDEFAVKDYQDGYSLDVESIPEAQQVDLLSEIMKSDTSLRETILIGMQKLIDKRLADREVQTRYASGYRLSHCWDGDPVLTNSI